MLCQSKVQATCDLEQDWICNVCTALSCKVCVWAGQYICVLLDRATVQFKLLPGAAACCADVQRLHSNYWGHSTYGRAHSRVQPVSSWGCTAYVSVPHQLACCCRCGSRGATTSCCSWQRPARLPPCTPSSSPPTCWQLLAAAQASCMCIGASLLCSAAHLHACSQRSLLHSAAD